MKQSKNIKTFVATVLCSISATFLFAQTNLSVNVVLKQPQLLMGQQTQLFVETKTTLDKPVLQWFNLPDTFNHIEIISRSAIDSSLQGNTKIYHQSFTVTGFDSGVWVIPPLIIHTANKQAQSTPVALTIIPAKLTDSTYHDIRDIIMVAQQKTTPWYWILSALLSAILLCILAWLWYKKRKPKTVVVNKSALPLLQETLQQLKKLKAQNLFAKEEWKKYYTELTNIFKTYYEQKFGNGALQKTTDEMLMLANQHLSKDLLSQLAETLRMAEAAKFAKYQPDITRSTIDIDVIETIVKKLDSLK
jgi:hypothetical protein